MFLIEKKGLYFICVSDNIVSGNMRPIQLSQNSFGYTVALVQ